MRCPILFPATAVLSLALAACQRDVPSPQGADPAGPAPAAVTAAQHQPAADRPPGEATGSNIPRVVDGTVSFEGFGPATFGSDPEQVRIAWGNDLGDARPSEPGGCYVLTPHPLGGSGYDIGFMVEGERFVRIDVRNPGCTAPGGGKVGMARADLERLYAGRIEATPHKYVEGAQSLRIAGPDGERAAVFETDTAGVVTAWRIGLPPQVDYVETCG